MNSSAIVDADSKRLMNLPVKLAVILMQSFILTMFVFITVMFGYYLHLRYYKSTSTAVHPISDDFSSYDDTQGSGIRASVPVAQQVNGSTREYCKAVSKELFSLEKMGYVDKTSRFSKLLSLDLGGTQDVHYVFVNTTHIPWKVACSLESALGAVGPVGRVNVFVVSGMEFDRIDNNVDVTQPVSDLAK